MGKVSNGIRGLTVYLYTHVHPVWCCRLFNDKAATYNIDGTNTTGIFSFDLTLAEIKQLGAIQPLAFRNQDYNGMYGVGVSSLCPTRNVRPASSLPTVLLITLFTRSYQRCTGRPVGGGCLGHIL